MSSETVTNTPLPVRIWTSTVAVPMRRARVRATVALKRDWAERRVLAGGAIVFALAALVAVVFHLNSPTPFIPYHDSLEYIRSADRIASGGWWVDADRLPGYPLLLAIVFLLTGKNNLAAADATQYVLFALTAVEVYVLSLRLWRNTVFATLIGGLFATNFYFLSYTRPLLSDGLALALTISFALAVVLYIERPRVGWLWAIALLLLALIMTRAEWYLLPAPLFAYCAFRAYRSGRLRELLPHAVVATLLIYALLGLYVRLNARVTGVVNLTEIENLNLYGKVIQYHMQNEAPAQYASVARITDGYVRAQEYDPWFIVRHEPSLDGRHFALIGAYARAIIVRHPIQFLFDSGRLMYRSLYIYWPFAPLNPAGLLAGPLYALEHFSVIAYALFALFPFCLVGWWILLWRQRAAPERRTEIICALTGLIVYDLVTTTVGSYGEYPRLHLTCDPLILMITVGSLLLLARRISMPALDAGARETTEQAHITHLERGRGNVYDSVRREQAPRRPRLLHPLSESGRDRRDTRRARDTNDRNTAASRRGEAGA